MAPACQQDFLTPETPSPPARDCANVRTPFSAGLLLPHCLQESYLNSISVATTVAALSSVVKDCSKSVNWQVMRPD